MWLKADLLVVLESVGHETIPVVSMLAAKSHDYLFVNATGIMMNTDLHTWNWLSFLYRIFLLLISRRQAKCYISTGAQCRLSRRWRFMCRGCAYIVWISYQTLLNVFKRFVNKFLHTSFPFDRVSLEGHPRKPTRNVLQKGEDIYRPYSARGSNLVR